MSPAVDIRLFGTRIEQRQQTGRRAHWVRFHSKAMLCLDEMCLLTRLATFQANREPGRRPRLIRQGRGAARVHTVNT